MPDTPLNDCFVSLVVPLYNEGPDIADFISAVTTLLQNTYTNYELLLIDNGSTDDTADVLQPLLKKLSCIRVIRLSRSYDREVALFAGLDASIGDYVITLIPGVDPIANIPRLVEKLQKGNDIIYGISTSKRPASFFSRIGAQLFQRYSEKVLHLPLPAHSTYFIGLNRRAVNALTRVKSYSRHLRILSGLVGFKSSTFKYEPIESDRYQQRTFRQSFNLAIDISVNYSRHPLRLVTYLGLIAGLLNLLYVLYVVVIYLFDPQVAAGWTTLSLEMAIMFIFVFLILTVLSEYIGKILEESKNQPAYHVIEELTSTVILADPTRRNVHTS